ncbi:SPOR domain-containing protein [Ferrovibrio sp.]|uniref:SPOR domain-containing protein n=1 Tax=Ferrovibrio sp. TaxID=1917215 RepID=UPI00260A83BD|nr:SPOR domain-containing protein [Ferrovibrio sp.]
MSDLRSDRGSRPVPGEPERVPASPKKIITAAIALGAVAAFGIGIWFAYDQGVKRGASGAPPLIRADQGPTKVAPENPGGMQVPNQDKQIYERLGGNGQQQAAGTEKLLPPPERPSAAPTQPNAVTVPNRPAPATVPGQSPVQSPVQSSGLPNRTDAPSPSAVTTPAPSQPVAPKAEEKPAATPAPATRAPAQAATTPAPAATPKVTATPGGSAKIQLASLKDQAAAQATWSQLQKKFPDILGGLTPSYEKVEIAGKGTFIRLQAGPLKDRVTAQNACQQLAAKNQGCIVVGR